MDDTAAWAHSLEIEQTHLKKVLDLWTPERRKAWEDEGGAYLAAGIVHHCKRHWGIYAHTKRIASRAGLATRRPK